MNCNTLLILAAGASSRMRKSLENTESFKGKALIGLGERKRPVIDYLLQNAEKAGYTHVILVVGKEADAFKNHIKGNPRKKLTISFANQHIPKGREKPLGTADAVSQAMEQYPELQHKVFAVCNSDNLYSVHALQLLRMEQSSNAFISYDRNGLDFPAERIRSFALLVVDTAGFLKDLVEKPSEAIAETYRDAQGVFRVSMNLWKLNGTEAFPFLRDCPLHPTRLEKELPNAILAMVKKGITIKGIPLQEHVPDLTSKEDIEKFESYLKKS